MIKKKLITVMIVSFLLFQYIVPFGEILQVYAVTGTDITALSGSKTNTTVSLKWTNPTDANFDHANIYRDGVLIGNTKKTDYPIFHDTSVVMNTTYSYTVTSVDTNGEETTGISIDVTTDSAASNEILKGLWMVHSDDIFKGTTLTNKVTDRLINSTTLYYSGGSTDTLWTELPTTYDVDSYALKGESSLKLTLYNEQKQVIQTVNAMDTTGNKGYFQTTYAVKYVKIENTSGSLRTIDELSLYQAEGPYEASGLNASQTDKTVSLNWIQPPQKDLDYLNVYRNGAFIGKVENDAFPMFHDNTVQPNTTYTYRITAVDTYNKNGEITSKETAGLTITVTTEKDASNEVLKGLWMVQGSDIFKGTTLTNKLTDRVVNNINISYSGSGTSVVWTELPTAYDIDSYGLKASGAGSLKMTLYNEQKQIIQTVNSLNESGNRMHFPLTYGVKYVKFENTTGSLKSTDEMYLYKAEGPYELSGLNAVQTDKTVSLNWIHPPQKELDYLNIYRDGVFLAKVENDALPIFHDNTVQPNTTYTYRVTAVDTYNKNGEVSSKETAGLATTVTTDLPNMQNADDILKGLWMIKGSDAFVGTTLIKKLTDRMVSNETIYYKGETVWTELPTAYDITSYAAKGEGAGSLQLTLYNDQKQILTTINNIDVSGKRIYFPMVQGVKYASFKNTSASSIKTVDELYLYQVKDVAEISGLSETHTNGKVTLSWDNPNDNSIQSFAIYRDGLKIATVNTFSYTDTSVNPNTKYRYTVKAVSGEGVESKGTSIDVTTDKNPDVTNVKETHTNKQVTLTWNNPSFTGLQGAVVYRDGVKLTSIAGNTFTDNNVLAKTHYIYTIKTEDSKGFESGGVDIQVVTHPNAPKKPINLKATNITHDTIAIGWDETEDATSYTVKQDGKVVYTGSNRTFTVSALQPNTFYTFEVVASNLTGESEPAKLGVKTMNEPGKINIEFFFKEFPLAASYEISREDLKWTYYPSDAVDGYIHHREENVESNKIYKYTIRVKNSAGEVIKEVEKTIDTTDSSHSNGEIKEEIDWDGGNGNGNSSETEIGTKKEYEENGKKVEEITVKEDALDTYLQDNPNTKIINVCSSDVADVQKINLPIQTIDTMKQRNIVLACQTDTEHIKIDTGSIVIPPKTNEVQIKTENEKKPTTEDKNGGKVQGDIWAGIELTFIDENGNEIDMSHHAGGAKVEVPFFSKDDIHEWNVYKYNEETGTYDVIRSKSRDGYKVFEIDGIGGKYLFGKFDKKFEDVPSRHWGSQVIDFMVGKHFLDGTGEKTFSPDKQVTRAEFTAMLVKALGYKDTTLTKSKFKDIKTNAWYYHDILIAEEYGLIKGISNTAFAPNQTLTREQMLAILVRVMEKEGIHMQVSKKEEKEIAKQFKDYKLVSEWAKNSVAKSIKYEITVGTTETTLAPKTIATRAHAAAFIQRTMKRIEWY